MKKKNLSGVTSLALILILFLLVAYIVQINLDFFTKWIGSGFSGMVVFILIISLAAVLAPVSVLPLVPLASALWGWILAGFLTLIGEILGAIIVFIISRKYGYPLVRKIASLKKVHKIERFLPYNHMFLGIIILRVAIPIDIVSYGLGLFSKVKFKPYVLASAIGLIPYAFVIAYLGGLSFETILLITVVGLVLFFIVILAGLRKRKSIKEKFLFWWDLKFRGD